MSGRIRELEDALGETQPNHSLLRDDLLLIKKSADLFGVEAQSAAEAQRNEFQPGPPSSSPLRDDVGIRRLSRGPCANVYLPATEPLACIPQWRLR